MHIYGNISLLLSWLFMLLSLVLLLLGNLRKDGRFLKAGVNALFYSFFLVVLSSMLLVYALATLDYSIEYVVLQATKSMPIVYRIAGFWAGMEGSMLFWNLIYGIYVVLFILYALKKGKLFYRWSFFFISFTYFFFLTVLVFFSNPFEPSKQVVEDGRGLNPLLLNWWMHIHPISLYLGYTGLSVPFAIVLGTLLTRTHYSRWISDLRIWTFVPWIFLTLGIYFGGRWAYLELGWGGYWAWDPVENASFIPWLTSTALIHSIIVQQARGMFKMWNAVLSVMTFILVLLGTYITRSGSLVSVHSFAQSELGNVFFLFIILTLVLSFWIIYANRRFLHSYIRVYNIFSRDGFFLLNNWILVLLAFTVAFGTLFPRISAFFVPNEIMVGPTFYETVSKPLFTAMLFLMAFAPYIPYGGVSARAISRLIPPMVLSTLLALLSFFFVRSLLSLIALWSIYMIVLALLWEVLRVGKKGLLANLRRYGGLVVHVGVAITAFGIMMNTLFKQRTEVILSKGEVVETSGYKLKYVDVKTGFEGDYMYSRFNFLVQTPLGKEVQSYPELRFYHKWNMKVPEIDILTSLKGDFYIAPGELEEDTGRAFIVIFFEPFIQIVWIGPVLMVLGALISLIGSRLWI